MKVHRVHDRVHTEFFGFELQLGAFGLGIHHIGVAFSVHMNHGSILRALDRLGQHGYPDGPGGLDLFAFGIAEGDIHSFHLLDLSADHFLCGGFHFHSVRGRYFHGGAFRECAFFRFHVDDHIRGQIYKFGGGHVRFVSRILLRNGISCRGGFFRGTCFIVHKKDGLLVFCIGIIRQLFILGLYCPVRRCVGLDSIPVLGFLCCLDIRGSSGFIRYGSLAVR